MKFGIHNPSSDSETVQRKFAVLRRHCDTAGRNYDEIERTNVTSLLLARDEAALKAKREGCTCPTSCGVLRSLCRRRWS
jgi:hypothetical protein